VVLSYPSAFAKTLLEEVPTTTSSRSTTDDFPRQARERRNGAQTQLAMKKGNAIFGPLRFNLIISKFQAMWRGKMERRKVKKKTLTMQMKEAGDRDWHALDILCFSEAFSRRAALRERI
jgi:hypothetical protein